MKKCKYISKNFETLTNLVSIACLGIFVVSVTIVTAPPACYISAILIVGLLIVSTTALWFLYNVKIDYKGMTEIPRLKSKKRFVAWEDVTNVDIDYYNSRTRSAKIKITYNHGVINLTIRESTIHYLNEYGYECETFHKLLVDANKKAREDL